MVQHGKLRDTPQHEVPEVTGLQAVATHVPAPAGLHQAVRLYGARVWLGCAHGPVVQAQARALLDCQADAGEGIGVDLGEAPRSNGDGSSTWGEVSMDVSFCKVGSQGEV